MMPFIEQLEKNCINFSDRLAVALDHKKEPVTYGELWNLSGKIYSYLKNHNVGKEDFVLINLPRGSKIIVAMIGIWRAGAAGTITEKDYPAERVEYIRKDCNAKIVIDENIYNEMLAGETLSGYEKTNPNDACFAVYTSGTTGNPKGALHEYGKLNFCIQNYFVTPNFEYGKNYIHAATYPMNFVVFFMWWIPHFYFGNSFYILSYEIIKDFNSLGKIIADEKISEIFISPSLLKFFKNVPPNMRIIYTGGDNVSDIYFPNVILINDYGMSETAFLVSAFNVNKPYHKTPVGKNFLGSEISILNDDGQPVPNGEQGEICFDNPYFRGYINLPEKTAEIFKGGIFHSGDLGYKDEHGNLIIGGRKDDMIKIHGNRVEPLEIEIVAKKILGVKNIIAKGFSDNGFAFIALYGLISEIGDKFDEKNISALRENFSKFLPQYMIPDHFITLENFPTNANGKVSRKLFPAPKIKKIFCEYFPPVTETEKFICEKMSKVLGVEKFSRNADFYQMGGDSLKTILLVTECENFSIQSADVYKYRTPEKLAAFCDENKNFISVKKFSPAQEIKEKIFPAIKAAHQNYLNTGTISSMYSKFFALKEENIKKISMSPSIEIILTEKINPVRLQDAVNKAVKICPYVNFEISNSDEKIFFQKNNLPLLVHRAGTLENFGTAENNRHYVSVAFDDDKIIFNFSHILTDGFGINCFVQAVLDFYFGKEKTFYAGANEIDFVADLMAENLPLPEGYAPKNYMVENHFVPPEIDSVDGKTTENFIEIPAKKFNDFCQKYEISAQIAVSFLLAEAVQKVHTENKKIIAVRGPVNTRIPLQVPNTFQNAGIPHIFLNFEPQFLNGEISGDTFENVKKDFSDQYNYENLAAFTNKLKKFFTTNDNSERLKIISDYKTQTDIFANYMGKVLADDVSKFVKSFKQKIPASFPLMVYALQYGEIVGLQILQSFESPIYIESLKKILKDI